MQRSSFVPSVVGYLTPGKFKPHVVTPIYDGSTNPIYHIEMYQSEVNIYSTPDEMR